MPCSAAACLARARLRDAIALTSTPAQRLSAGIIFWVAISAAERMPQRNPSFVAMASASPGGGSQYEACTAGWHGLAGEEAAPAPRRDRLQSFADTRECPHVFLRAGGGAADTGHAAKGRRARRLAFDSNRSFWSWLDTPAPKQRRKPQPTGPARSRGGATTR